MKQNEKKEKDWSKEESWQIAVYKTDKALLELCEMCIRDRLSAGLDCIFSGAHHYG